MSQDRKKHHRPVGRSDLGKWPHDKLWPRFLYSKATELSTVQLDDNAACGKQACKQVVEYAPTNDD